jgi:O-antigen chain-terminating methyltransferase
MSDRTYTLDDFACADPREFVDVAYRTIVGRLPTAEERERMLEALVTGGTRTFALGALRYGREGRARGVAVAGLRSRYLAQRLFRLPVLGAAFGWLGALVRLPRTLRYFRGAVETGAVHHSLLQQQQSTDRAALGRRADDGERRLDDAEQRLADTQHRAADAEQRLADTQHRVADAEQRLADTQHRVADADRRIADAQRTAAELERALAEAARTSIERLADLDRRVLELQQCVDGLTSGLQASVAHLRALDESSHATRTRVDAMHPPPLDATMAVTGEPLTPLARERAGIAPDVELGTLSAHSRYALFETVFYDSRAVAAKQRVYIDHVDRELAQQAPFVDLGCGRGEFLHILQELGIEAVGVDINADVLRRLRTEGFTVVEQDLLGFLEGEHRMFCGASVLQVAEHLTAAQLERLLALLAQRLLPGAPLIIETPNPLSPFALAVFHTDPTHISPIPPERMRYSIEAAGFEQTLTLFQAKIPADQFAGPDPRAYYADYAIIARRSAQ